MAEKITSKTTLAQIQDYVRADFGIEIDKETAKEIKSQGAKGCTVWSPRRLTTVSGITIVPGKRLA